jgi:histone deacetylase complex subunit SAP18
MASVSGESTSTKLGGNAMDMELDDDPRPTHGRKVEEKTLDGYGFVIGDLISVSIHVPEPRAAQSRSGAPGMPPQERGSGGFGWQRDRESGNGPREREAPPSEREGHWARGEALPPQNSFRGENAFRGGRGGFGRVEPAGGRAGGIGIRGAGRRSPERERDGLGGRRSRSPEGRERRESWSRR